MNKEQIDLLMSAIENAGGEPRSYSGRGMMGDRCLGVTCSNPFKLLVGVIKNLTDELSSKDGEENFISNYQEILSKLGEARTDSMGHDVIVYWPSIDWDPSMEEYGDQDEFDDE